jgi:hypothetical protein
MHQDSRGRIAILPRKPTIAASVPIVATDVEA